MEEKDIQNILRSLRHIEADKRYVRSSRAAILADGRQSGFGIWRFLMNSLQFGSSIALVGLLLILAVGGFSTWRFLSPFRLSSLDPVSIRAEAQAIDIQIKLANVGYSDVQNAETTQVTEEGERTPMLPTEESGESPETGKGAENSATTTEPISIDEALERLIE